MCIKRISSTFEIDLGSAFDISGVLTDNYLGDLPPALNEGEVVVDVLLLLHLLPGQHPLRPQQGHQDVLRVVG